MAGLRGRCLSEVEERLRGIPEAGDPFATLFPSGQALRLAPHIGGRTEPGTSGKTSNLSLACPPAEANACLDHSTTSAQFHRHMPQAELAA